ncbi:GNAT family N-acetyltransferase [Deinococcus alpinitundrae]|uniref:GNAT family N-acetyltransferase n=1 Tax=Deinococcus alpinitundrae TaxID=468913 RepID=UPI00192A5D4A|nr:GNAT family N-acetyltransferase [Deinococcus alpinitundrae]
MMTRYQAANLDVQLRSVQDADLDVLFAHQQDPQARYLAAFVSEDPFDRAAFDGHWQRIRNNPSVSAFAILVDGKVAGEIGAFDRDGDREVTYWIDQAFWGRGVATTALNQLLLLERQRPLHGRVVADNVASQRVLKKCGFAEYDRARGYANGRGEEVVEILFRLDD